MAKKIGLFFFVVIVLIIYLHNVPTNVTPEDDLIFKKSKTM